MWGGLLHKTNGKESQIAHSSGFSLKTESCTWQKCSDCQSNWGPWLFHPVHGPITLATASVCVSTTLRDGNHNQSLVCVHCSPSCMLFPHSIHGCSCYSILSMPFSICSIILFSVTAGISQTSFVRWSPFLHVLQSGQTLWLLRPTGYNRSDPVPISGETFTWPCSFCFLFFGRQPIYKKCKDTDQCCFSCISLVDLLCYTNKQDILSGKI